MLKDVFLSTCSVSDTFWPDPYSCNLLTVLLDVDVRSKN